MSDNPPSPTGSREPATVRIAMWSARHRWPVVALWFIATIGLMVVSLQIGGINAANANSNPNERKLESSEAYDVFNAGGTNDPYEQFLVVVAGPPGATARSCRSRRRSSDLVGRLHGAGASVDGVMTPTFDQLADPFAAPPAAGLVSPDGSAVRIVARVPGDSDRVKTLLAPVPAIIDGSRAANPALVIHAVSGTFINDDITKLINDGLDASLRLTIPLTFIILLFAFGAIVASVVPLVLAITSLLAAFGMLGIYSQLTGPVSPNATQLIVLIGLAVAVDYSLFMITRSPRRAAGRARAGQGDRGLEQHGRTGCLLLRVGRDDLACRPHHPRRLALHLDGGRDHLGRSRLGHREPDLPSGDPVDPRRSGQRRAPGHLAAATRRGPAARPDPTLGPIRARLARPPRDPPGGIRFLGPPGQLGDGPPRPHDDPVGRVPALPRVSRHPAADGRDRHHRVPRFDRRGGRDQAAQRAVAAGHRAAAPGRGDRGRPAGHASRDRPPQDGGAQESPG